MALGYEIGEPGAECCDVPQACLRGRDGVRLFGRAAEGSRRRGWGGDAGPGPCDPAARVRRAGTIMKRTSTVYRDDQLTIKLDDIEGMDRRFVQVLWPPLRTLPWASSVE